MFKIGEAVKLRSDTHFAGFSVPKGTKGLVAGVRESRFIQIILPKLGQATVMDYELVLARVSAEKEIKGKNLRLWDKICTVDGRWGEVFGLEQNLNKIDILIWVDNDMEYRKVGKKERIKIKR